MVGKSEEKRIEIATLLRASHTKADIVKRLNVSRMTVYRVAKRLSDGETLKDRHRDGRPRVVKTKSIKKAFQRDPTLKMTHLAKKRGISESTVRRAVKIEGGKSFKLVKKPLLTPGTKQKRLDRAKILLNNLKNHGNRVVIFSDEKTFTVDPVMNKQNDRVVSFGQDVSEYRNVSTTKHPASVMMLGVVASNGLKMPPIWFPTGYRLTAANYKEVLEEKVLPWVKRVLKKSDYVFQQDGAPAHTAKVVQKWMHDNMSFWPKTFWPPQSPDLNPLDYSIWTHVESKACKCRHSSVEDLKKAVNRSWASMRKAYIRKVCLGFRPRLERVINAEGGYIE